MEKQKRFYQKNEMVWIVNLKREGKVVDIHKDRTPIAMTVSFMDNGQEVKVSDAIWKFDKLKYSAKEKLVEEKSVDSDEISELLELMKSIFNPDVYFAKVRETAIIPSKNEEDAGYDIYANLDAFARETEEGIVYEIECPVFATTLVPTGIASAMPSTHYLNAKHERGSTGVQSMSVLAGVIDSGYRDEIFIALTPLRKSVLITSAVSKVEVNETHILYPLSKAIAQGTIDLVPKANVIEIAFDKLKSIPSIRGTGKLGESGK